MSKFSIGITYTVWTDVEANSEAEAVNKAVNTDYDVPAHFELNEYDDPKVLLMDQFEPTEAGENA